MRKPILLLLVAMAFLQDLMADAGYSDVIPIQEPEDASFSPIVLILVGITIFVMAIGASGSRDAEV